MEAVIQEIAKASPFAGLCIGIIFIVNNGHSKNLKHVKEMFDRSLITIKEAYKDGAEANRQTMIVMSETLNEFKGGKKGKTPTPTK